MSYSKGLVRDFFGRLDCRCQAKLVCMDSINRNHNSEVKVSSNRSFGFVFALVFAMVGLLPYFHGRGVHGWAILSAALFGFSAIWAPELLAPLNRLWARFGQSLHRFASPIALGLIFYLTVLPTGLLMRLFGKDPLKLRLDQSANSYWVKREPQSPSAESLNNQF